MIDGALGTAAPWWPRARRLLASNQLAAWAGQGIVSATNFAILIILARAASAADVGYYAVGYSLLALAMVAQDSLVTRPYAIQMFKPPGGPGAHAYGSLVFALLLLGLIGLALAAAAGFMRLGGMAGDFSAIVLVLAAAAPLALTREFARRFCFANMQMRQALALDTAASGLILTLLMALAAAGWLGAASALGVIGLSSGACAIVWFLLRRASFRPAAGAVAATARQSWDFGKWLLASQVTLQVQGYVAHWLTMIMAGAAATGVYSACLSIVSLSNPFLFGLFNLLTPKFVRILKDKGASGLRREAFRDAAAIAAIMGCFTLVLYFGGGFLLSHLFPRGDFSDGASVLPVLALAAAVSALGAPATIALSVAERGRSIAGLSLLACLLALAAVGLLLPRFGLLGAALGMLAAECLGTLARWGLFLFGAQAPAVRSPTPQPAPERQ